MVVTTIIISIIRMFAKNNDYHLTIINTTK